MCGIAGYIDYSGTTQAGILQKMTDTLVHRGPDAAGYEELKLRDALVGLGHRRLSILDLSEQGNQPMFSRDKELVIVFNGEIYNFREIKSQLEQDGYTFHSTSDTEVLLNAWQKWGVDAVKRCIGMFAFVLLDKKENAVYFFRDRAGIKPLYYYERDGLLLFASELKSFHQHPGFEKMIAADTLAPYMKYGYIPNPYTIFKHTWKLEPGHYLRVNLTNRAVRKETYWDVYDYYNQEKLCISEQEAQQQLETLMQSAFNYRMVSDVPVGVFLSGGYDSSAVAALLQKDRTDTIKTFTIGFHEQKFNEAGYAKKVAEHLGTDHTEYYCSTQDALEIIPQLPELFDEPFGDSSAIPTFLVSRIAREKVTVALSADAGDETLAGYDKYWRSIKYRETFGKYPWIVRKILHRVFKIISPDWLPIVNKTTAFHVRYKNAIDIFNNPEITAVLDSVSQYVSPNELKRILAFGYRHLKTCSESGHLLNSHNDDINRMLAVDYKTYLVDDILTKVDRATMAVSLEGRDPLLDHRIIEFAARLPSDLKLRGTSTKILLKNIVHSYLPQDMMERRKMGFTIPISEWFGKELIDYFRQYLSRERIEADGLFNFTEIVKIRDGFIAGRRDNEFKLWFLLMFQMWKEKWM